MKSTPEVQQGRPVTQDQTIMELVKLMNTTLKNTNSKETTTDLPKFTGKDAQWERWYELLRSYFQAKGWLDTLKEYRYRCTIIVPYMLTVCMLYFLCGKILGGSYLILGIPIFMYKQSLDLYYHK